MTSGFWFHNDRKWRGPVDFSHLPLEPISTLRDKANAEILEDKKKRLAQILALPLERMTPYCKEKRGDRSTVYCRLCSRSHKAQRKEDWVDHFRIEHWTRYRSMIGGCTTPTSWILLEDISEEEPIYSDDEVEQIVKFSSPGLSIYPTEGPSLIRRFVVVRGGVTSCLCIGIHT